VEESHAQSKVSDSVATPGAVCNPPSGRGRILAGRYRLGRQLGSGTFARVYEATDLEVERRAGSTAEDARVAIKLFNRDMHLKEPWRAENEALLHGQLSSHPNVVSLIAAHLVPQPGRLSDTLLRAAAAAAFASAKSTSWPGSLAVPDSSFSAVAVESDAAAAAAAAASGRSGDGAIAASKDRSLSSSAPVTSSEVSHTAGQEQVHVVQPAPTKSRRTPRTPRLLRNRSRSHKVKCVSCPVESSLVADVLAGVPPSSPRSATAAEKPKKQPKQTQQQQKKKKKSIIGSPRAPRNPFRSRRTTSPRTAPLESTSPESSAHRSRESSGADDDEAKEEEELPEQERDSFLVLQYAPGGDLLSLVSDSPTVLSEEQARNLFVQVVSAVQFMHASGICHRDLKLENVLLSEDHKHAWLCDWGFACRWSTEILRKESCGSVHYASPELLVGEGYTGNEIDMWSLGVLLYALVTQRLPFYAPSSTLPADEAYEVALRVISGRYEMPSTLSPALQNLILLCLQPDAQSRIVIDQVMQHPWMRGEVDMPSESPPDLTPLSSPPTFMRTKAGPSSSSSSSKVSSAQF